MTPERLAEDLVPIAAELVGTVRDYGPDVTGAILDPLTPAHWYRLTVILAAMVDPDRTPTELLSWLDKPTPSRTFTPTAFRDPAAGHASRLAARRVEITRLTAEGLGPTAIAEQLGLTKRTVVRHRAALRAATRAA